MKSNGTLSAATAHFVVRLQQLAVTFRLQRTMNKKYADDHVLIFMLRRLYIRLYRAERTPRSSLQRQYRMAVDGPLQ
jgi:hypothetical protein